MSLIHFFEVSIYVIFQFFNIFVQILQFIVIVNEAYNKHTIYIKIFNIIIEFVGLRLYLFNSLISQKSNV